MTPQDQVAETAERIKSMEIRGAGRIATAAAASLRDLALQLDVGSPEEFNLQMERAAQLLLSTRPTAISLYNAVRSVMRYEASNIEQARRTVVENADRFIESASIAVQRIGEFGSKRIRAGDTVLTHCNSMAALSVISAAHRAGKDIRVIATESRPRYQGLTTIKMLEGYGISTELIVDSAVRTVMNEVDLVVVGADVIAANGTLVNKIGTGQIALCAHEAQTCFMVAAETYKFSPLTILGELVPIEERGQEEVLADISKYAHVRVRNPAFDITPRQYIDVICTEVGLIPPEMSYMIIKENLGWELQDIRLLHSSQK
jgi:ribose 1,5-bisphosphate isomerase